MNWFTNIKNKWRSLKTRNPLYSYNKVKKFFKRPEMRIYLGPVRSCRNWNFQDCWFPVYINSFDVGWDDKSIYPDENYACYRNPPELNIVFFKRWQLLFRWYPDVICKDEDLYWETLLNLAYFNMNIKESIENNVHITYIWYEDEDGNKRSVEDKRITAYTEEMLTDFGKKEYERLISVNSEQKSEK